MSDKEIKMMRSMRESGVTIALIAKAMECSQTTVYNLSLIHIFIFMWELPGEEIEIEGEMKPRAISETYTNSLGEKANLRKMLENWRGRAFTQEEMDGFDLRNVLGLSLIHI